MTRRPAIALLGVLAAAIAATWAWSAREAGRGYRQQLAQAIGDELPFPARLSGGFAPGQRPALRSGAETPAVLSPDARIALATLERAVDGDASAQAKADLGVAYLIQGELDRAISLLHDAASETNAPLHWSDLSAAYLVKASRTPQRRVEFLSRGFDAAALSLTRGASDEALFNRTLALDGLASYVAEAAPWSEYAHGESDARWVDAANRFLATQQAIDDPNALWEARRRELRVRLTAMDARFVRDTAREFPEASREHLEQEVIAAWARAYEAGEKTVATAHLAQARLLAEALFDVTGDAMARDEVSRLAGSRVEIARAHLAFVEGAKLYEANKYPHAKAALQRALDEFSRTGHPYRYWALARRAAVDFQLREVASANAALGEVEAFARAHQYPTVLAWALWVRGLIDLQDFSFGTAIAAFEEAAREIERTQQREFAVSLYHLLANNLRTLGEQQRSWEYIGKTLDGLSLVRKPTRRYISYYNASLFATHQELHEAALVFQNAAVREATKAGVEVKIDALTQRAGVHVRRGDPATAARDLDDAAGLLEHVADGSLKHYLQAEIDVLYAQLHLRDAPAESATRVRNAISFFDRVEPARIPRLFLELARIHLAAGAVQEAAGAMTQGIERLERQQAGVATEALKISYFDQSWELFDDMVSLQLTRLGNADAAFAFAERSRARSLRAAREGTELPRPRDLQALREALPAGIELVSYYLLRDRLLVWMIDRSRVQLIEEPVDARELTRLAAQFRDGASEGRIHQSISDTLYRVLWTPVTRGTGEARTVVIVADGALQQVPFAALRDPSTGRYVVEDYTVLASPSASFYVSSAARSREHAQEITSALLVGNPESSSHDRLPDAEREVTQAAHFYAHPEVLLGRAATKSAFLERASRFSVIHFGGHAVANPEYPLLSRLMFAPESGGEALYAHEMSGLRFPRTQLVILAACSTARGAISRGEGALNVARPFLAGGVPVVIASQWDVDDLATSELFLAFHREFAVSKDAARALRHAQLQLLRDPSLRHSSPASWGAFVALGATTHEGS
jgi:CHAT domain-containing protein/tetratricopeptide (TPR) repeat protein